MGDEAQFVALLSEEGGKFVASTRSIEPARQARVAAQRKAERDLRRAPGRHLREVEHQRREEIHRRREQERPLREAARRREEAERREADLRWERARARYLPPCGGPQGWQAQWDEERRRQAAAQSGRPAPGDALAAFWREPARVPEREAAEGAQCAICFEDILGKVPATGCRHDFHGGCLDAWRRAGGANCPVCRGPLP